MGYESMTPIQAQSLPAILDNKDVIAQGKTGSGKTAAFGLGLLNKLEVKRFCIQTLVLCPTRELADQVANEIRKLARQIHNIKVLLICGGANFGRQIGSLEHGAHIIVGTPGRIEDHLSRGTLKLDKVNTLVLDEADRMLEMGFQTSLDAITAQIPEDRQTLLFSATFPEQINKIASKIMRSPIKIEVESSHDNSSIEQQFFLTESKEDKLDATRRLLLQHTPTSTVVFCNTKIETVELSNMLNNCGFSSIALNGDLEQRERDQALLQFANRSISVLVATDVAARGLDIDNLDLVINYNVAHDSEVHVHRIGRTGRAGGKGLACTLYSKRDDYKISLLADLFDKDITPASLPRESVLDNEPFLPTMTTLQIDGGKKQKVRPGDILGALTSENGLTSSQVGKINVGDTWAYIAVESTALKTAMDKLGKGKIKGRTFRVRRIR